MLGFVGRLPRARVDDRCCACVRVCVCRRWPCVREQAFAGAPRAPHSRLFHASRVARAVVSNAKPDAEEVRAAQQATNDKCCRC